uniref:Histidine--tRNA ligase, chloroplastic n=1 Tax=Polysiphonia sertularioides TaxID=945028 RepID=A0A1Z1M9T4_9FLOR|nr:Histidine-tRNA ligase [Polysiphonia sertularioides]ARW62581.1 Histidine-tRNA ligase [Polysiphonia sertularioides]
MQTLRGTKDILPDDIIIWQEIYNKVMSTLDKYGYEEIRTPILENTKLFERCIGDFTDIVNKEMYSFKDQSNRGITLRPEGTSSIARAIISNKIYLNNKMNRLWYFGPMFRYERPQKGRQRQFHQLGIECIGSDDHIADVEVIRIAYNLLKKLKCDEECMLEINSIGNTEEREIYTHALVEYLEKYRNEIDKDSQRRIEKNPLRVLDSKDLKTQAILEHAPMLDNYLNKKSLHHFAKICNDLEYLQIDYKVNNKLVRGLDYYNYTAFEIKTKENSQQNTICGGGRYDKLIEQLGGPPLPAVGWAIGIERLIILMKNKLSNKKKYNKIYIIKENLENYHIIWNIVNVLEEYKLPFELDYKENNLTKRIKRAYQIGAEICIILKNDDLRNQYIKIKWISTGQEQKIQINNMKEYFHYLKKVL